MLDLSLSEYGVITIEPGKISIDGFGADNAMCRETGALAMLWAIGELQRELTLMINKPGGSGAVSVD